MNKRANKTNSNIFYRFEWKSYTVIAHVRAFRTTWCVDHSTHAMMSLLLAFNFQLSMQCNRCWYVNCCNTVPTCGTVRRRPLQISSRQTFLRGSAASGAVGQRSTLQNKVLMKFCHSTPEMSSVQWGDSVYYFGLESNWWRAESSPHLSWEILNNRRRKPARTRIAG